MPEFAILDPALMRVPAENARQTGPGDVDQLVASIKEHGVLVPLTVIQRAGWYDVIDGQRRMTAAIAAGVDRVPCLVHAEGEIRAAEAGVAINAVRPWLADYRPLCVDEMCGIPNEIEEDEHVDPAAQPEVDAAHRGDTPGGHTGHPPVEDDNGGDDW